LIEVNNTYCMDNLELMKQMEDESVDLIYCDILYGTGKNFKDYQDLKPQRDIIEEFYIPRIKETHRILKGTGSIYLQMDWRISHWIRCILDDIFEHKNFRNEIIWKYGLGGGGNKEFAKKHDNILFYTKSKDYTFNLQYEPATSNMMKGKMKKMTDVWDVPTLNNMAKERVGYDTQKPKELISRIIKASSNEGDIVADFFCGSGTTLVVAKELGRQYIGCDINPKAIEITNNRLLEIN
jgi:site-specific DNA-methyltransferase (adenine-specific)